MKLRSDETWPTYPLLLLTGADILGQVNTWMPEAMELPPAQSLVTRKEIIGLDDMAYRGTARGLTWVSPLVFFAGTTPPSQREFPAMYFHRPHFWPLYTQTSSKPLAILYVRSEC